jgi:hypothetical protein
VVIIRPPMDWMERVSIVVASKKDRVVYDTMDDSHPNTIRPFWWIEWQLPKLDPIVIHEDGAIINMSFRLDQWTR